MAHFTQSCSECFESEDGHPVGEYSWDEKAKCYVGAGCRECGYTGKRRVYFSIREINRLVKEDYEKLKREGYL